MMSASSDNERSEAHELGASARTSKTDQNACHFGRERSDQYIKSNSKS